MSEVWRRSERELVRSFPLKDSVIPFTESEFVDCESLMTEKFWFFAKLLIFIFSWTPESQYFLRFLQPVIMRLIVDCSYSGVTKRKLESLTFENAAVLTVPD